MKNKQQRFQISSIWHKSLNTLNSVLISDYAVVLTGPTY